MYLQRNENTITFSPFWALHFCSAVAWAVCDRIGSDLINEVSASIYALADEFVAL